MRVIFKFIVAMEENARNSLTRTLGSQWSQNLTFLLLMPGWLLSDCKRLSSILLLPLHLKSCPYIIRKKQRSFSTNSPSFLTFHLHFFICTHPFFSTWLTPPTTCPPFILLYVTSELKILLSSLESYLVFYLLTGHFLISLNIKVLSLDAASPSNCSPPYHDQNAKMNRLHRAAHS